jgi:hypothetical protein
MFFQKIIYLKNFLCSIRYRFKIDDDDDDNDQQIREDNLLNSFSTNFWLNQRKWFINYYSTISTTDQNPLFKVKNYGKLYLHTIPYPYSFMDATSSINTAKSTINQYIIRFQKIYFKDLQIFLEMNFKSTQGIKSDRRILSDPIRNRLEFRRNS